MPLTDADIAKFDAKQKPKRKFTDDDIAKHDQKNVEGGMDYGESGLYGAMQGASFNWSDEGLAGAKALYDKLVEGKDYGEAYEDRLEHEREQLERARKNPKSYMAGVAGGGLATAAIPGVGWANIGKAASLGKGMLTAGALGGVAGAGESEAGLEDPKELLKNTAIGAGTGAAFQGVLGKGADALKKLPAFARQKAAERAVKATTGQNIRAIRKMGGTTHASAGDIDKFAAGVRKVGDDIIDEVTPSGKPLMGAFDSVEDLAPKMAGARKHYGQKLGEVGKAVDAFYPKGAVQGGNISAKLRAYAEEIPAVDQGKNLIKRINTIADEFDEAGQLTFEKAKLFKNQFKYNQDDADLLVSNKDVTNKIRGIIGGEMDETADALKNKLGEALGKVKKQGPITVTKDGGIPPAAKGDLGVPPEQVEKVQSIKDLLDKYGHYKKKYGSFKQAADAATDRAQKNLSNRFVSPSDYGIGSSVGVASALASGNPAMLLMGAAGAAANKLARERGSSMAAVTLRKIANASKNPAFSNKYSKALVNAAGDGPTAMLGVHAVLMKTDPDYSNFFKEDY